MTDKIEKKTAKALEEQAAAAAPVQPASSQPDLQAQIKQLVDMVKHQQKEIETLRSRPTTLAVVDQNKITRQEVARRAQERIDKMAARNNFGAYQWRFHIDGMRDSILVRCDADENHPAMAIAELQSRYGVVYNAQRMEMSFAGKVAA